ncbi:MAG: glycosyltransferase [Gammaproteobacteria bacterium]|nr:glycosyltransferase [Gammaproteobacteria bacterium]
MRVVHLIAGDLTVGAHLGAHLLHKGLVKIGVDSWVLTTDVSEFLDERVVSVRSERWKQHLGRWRRRAEEFPRLIYPGRPKTTFSTGLFGGSLRNHPLIRSADVVNLHWVARDLLRVTEIRRLNKPIVWTLRDMWPFTGGCHYSLDCFAWRQGCGSCPQLSSSWEFDLSTLLQSIKRSAIPDSMICVGISSWISACAAESSIFSKNKIVTIPNCVDLDVYFPESKRESKTDLGLDPNVPVVLLGAAHVDDYYKGFDLFLAGVDNLVREKAQVVVFGEVPPSVRSALPESALCTGFIRDSGLMRKLYSSADVFVAPSRQEAFGKTLVEAMACATPVVGFGVSGPMDIVVHGQTGYLAKPFSSGELWEGIWWVLENTGSSGLGIAARRRALEEYSPEQAAYRYRDVYESLLV